MVVWVPPDGIKMKIEMKWAAQLQIGGRKNALDQEKKRGNADLVVLREDPEAERGDAAERRSVVTGEIETEVIETGVTGIVVIGVTGLKGVTETRAIGKRGAGADQKRRVVSVAEEVDLEKRREVGQGIVKGQGDLGQEKEGKIKKSRLKLKGYALTYVFIIIMYRLVANVRDERNIMYVV